MSGDIGNPVAPGAVPDEAARLAGMLGFVHPLVRHAVSEGLSEIERGSGRPARHAYFLKGLRRAAGGSHLLRVVPVTDSFVVATLRRAVDEGFARDTSTSVPAGSRGCSEPVIIRLLLAQASLEVT